MANMSYCMFENTVRDMVDILNRMQEAESLDELDLSEYELRAFHRLPTLLDQLGEEYARLTESEEEDDE